MSDSSDDMIEWTPKTGGELRTTERGASTIEWLFVAVLLVLLLTSFIKIVLPKLQVYGAKTAIETAMLDRISIAPPQLGLISGEGNPQNGLTQLNLVDPASFDQRVDGFFRTLHASIDPEITSYGFEPTEFEFCLVVKFQNRFLSETVEGQITTLSRSSRGRGLSCSDSFVNMLANTTNSQWASLRILQNWNDVSLIHTAHAASVSQEFIAIVGALDDDQNVCPENACIVAGPVAGQPITLPPPDTTATPAATQTAPPTATPVNTPTAPPTVAPTETETPLPSHTPSPQPSDTVAPTVTPIPSITPTTIPSIIPTIVTSVIPSTTPTTGSTITPTLIPTLTPVVISSATPTTIPPTGTPSPPLTPAPVFP